MNYKNIILPIALSFALTACWGGAKVEQKYPTSAQRDHGDAGGTSIYDEEEGIFGKGGILGSKDDDKSSDGAITVNSYLWRAALDTVSFMPLASADPFGGTILTDWYEDPATPGVRFKLNVLILERELKADGIRVRVFKQIRKGGTWKDTTAPEDMARKLEDAILTRARQMRAKKLGPID